MIRETIACVGAGRMGRSIAIAFAIAGHRVKLIDIKPREAADQARMADETRAEMDQNLATLALLGLLDDAAIAIVAPRIEIVFDDGADAALAGCDVMFEGIPEIVEMKRAALARIARAMPGDAIITSTTSTIRVDELAVAVPDPARFLNAHWLNPAYLIPLVELAPGRDTDPTVTARLKALLEGIGKVPVVCSAAPGFIVSRIQVLAMNEAARMVEQGVASAEDIDRAIRFGFGLRYATMGLLEFVDWGGGDILYYASRYLTEALQDGRYAAPDIVERNMAEGRTGMKARAGFIDYRDIDLDAFKLRRTRAMTDLLKLFGLTRPPVLDDP